LDSLGCALAGSTAPGVAELAAQMRDWGGAPQATLIAFGGRLPPAAASLVNGTMIHARDFDDTHDIAGVHACASALPAALAVAEARGGVPGREFLAAFIIGVEVACRLGLAVERYKGWHLTGICGAFGAAAAAARLIGLDARGTHMALGIALSQASGTLQPIQDGALTKRMHPGLAAQAGVLSAFLARRGVTGASEVFTGRFGFFHLFAGTKGPRTDPAEVRRAEGHAYRNAALVEGLGERYEVERLGLKPYPCCRASHGVLDGFLALIRREALGPEQVREVRARVSPWIARLVDRPFRPGESGVVGGQFSLPYHLAAALLRGDVFLDSFTEEGVADPQIADLLPRMRVIVDPAIAHKTPVAVEVDLADGRALRETVREVLGSPERPLREEEVRQKFRKCASYALRPPEEETAEQIVAAVERLEGLEDISRLAALLSL